MPAAEWFEFSSFSPSAGIRSQIEEIRQIRRACEAVAVRAGRSPFLARSDHFSSNSTGCRKRRKWIAHRIDIEGTRSAQAQPLLHPKCVSVAERAA